jgi:hypothetical protein
LLRVEIRADMARMAPPEAGGSRRGQSNAPSANKRRRKFSTIRSPQSIDASPEKPLFAPTVMAQHRKSSA